MSEVSNEQIISALLTAGTKKAAAASVGLSERAIYDRMKDADFKAEYAAAKADILRQTVIQLQERIQRAIITIDEVMTDPENNAAVRLQAAQTILNNSVKYQDQLCKGEKHTQQEIADKDFFTF